MSDLLARALDDVGRGRRTTAEVLADAGERSEELASLLAVAERIRSAEHPRPSAAFRTAAKARLLAKIAAGPGADNKEHGHANGHTNGHANGHANGHTNGDGDRLTDDDGTAVVAVGPGANGQLVPFSRLARVQRQRARRQGRPLWARALAKVVAASLVAALLGGGTVAVSADSLPGDVLYPAKIAAEQVYLATTRDEAERARLHIEFADRRLTELEKKVERGDAPSAAPLAAQYSDEVQAAATAIAHVATTSTSPNTQEKVDKLSTKLLEETTVQALKLEQVAERAPAVRSKLEEARATAAQAAAAAAAPRAQPEGTQPVAAALAQPRAAPTQGVPAGYPAPGTPPPTAQPTPAPTAAAAAPTAARTQPEGARPQTAPPSAAPKPAAEAALAPLAPPPPPTPTPPTAAPYPAPTQGVPAGYPAEGPGTRPKDGWGYPAPGTRLEGALATTEAQAGEIATGVRTGTAPALEDMVRGYTEALERMPDAFAADVAAGRSRDQVAAALAGRLSVQYETLVRAAEQASPADQPKLRRLLAAISDSMRGVLDDVGAAAPASLQPAPLPTQGAPGTRAPQPAASPTPRPPADPPPAPTKAATPLPPTAVASPLAEGTPAPLSPTVAATAQASPTAAPSPNPSAVATSGPAASATPVGSPAAGPTAVATGQPASPTPTGGAPPPGIKPTAPVTTPSAAPTSPTAAPTSPTAGPSTPTAQPQPSPTAVRTPSGALTPMRIGSPTAAATPQPAGSTPTATATPKK